MKNNKRTYFIETYGCQMNKYDSELVAGILVTHGYEQATSIEKADVVLVNTCSVRQHAEDRVRGRLNALRVLKNRNGKVVFGVLGCMAERLGSEIIKTQPFIDFTLGPDSYRKLPQVLSSLSAPKVHNDSSDTIQGEQQDIAQDDDIVDEYETYGNILPRRVPGVSAWVAIMRGCDNFCSYCIVPYVRGRERSRPAAGVVREVEQLAQQGFVEVTLLGQNVNSYNDGKHEFADLLVKVAAVPGIERVRFATSHPKDLSDKLIEAIACTPQICNHIHLPVQAGSDTILNAMNRNYTRNQYLKLVGRIRKSIPDISLTTDIIIGFPGESEEDFKHTKNLVEQVQFDSAFVFKYSPREGTAAAALPDTVPEQEKINRLQEINAIQKRITLKRNEKLVGKKVEILVEGPSKKSDKDAMGRNQTNKIVVFPNGSQHVGELLQVEIIGTAGHTLFGKLPAMYL